jgi:hypothetical protein
MSVGRKRSRIREKYRGEDKERRRIIKIRETRKVE